MNVTPKESTRRCLPVHRRTRSGRSPARRIVGALPPDGQSARLASRRVRAQSLRVADFDRMTTQGSLIADPDASSGGLFDAVQGHLDQAADRIGLDDGARKVLSTHRPRGRRLGAGLSGRRLVRRVSRLADPAQRRERSFQGRPPFPPERVPRRVPLLLGADDVEDGTARRAVRRRQGRREGRSEGPFDQRARAAVSFLLLGDRDDGGPVPRHPGARRQHGPARDGLDVRRVLEVARRFAGRDHREAGRAGRVRSVETPRPGGVPSSRSIASHSRGGGPARTSGSPSRGSATPARGSRSSPIRWATGSWRYPTHGVRS